MAIKDYLFVKPVLQTDNLILRPITADDTADLKEWMPDPDLYTYWGRPANRNELNPGEVFNDPRPNVKRKPGLDFIWGIAVKPANKVIGQVFIIEIENNRMAKIAYRIAKPYWCKGHTTEAVQKAVEFCFENTELQRIWTDVHINNIASCKVLEKSGFKKEGLIRQGKFNLTYCDYYLYGILKADYLAL